MSGHAHWHRGWCPFSLHGCEESRGTPGIFLIFGVWIVHICMTVWIDSNFKFVQVPCRMLAFHLIHLLTSEKQAMLTNWNLAIIIIHHSLLKFLINWFYMIQLYLWYSVELSDNENAYIQWMKKKREVHWIVFKSFVMLCIVDAYLSQLYKWSPNGSYCTSSCWDIQLTLQWHFNYENIAGDSNLTNNTILGI